MPAHDSSRQSPKPDPLLGEDFSTQPFKCKFVRIFPARFALSSEEAPPVQSQELPAYMRAVTQQDNLRYTLRVLRNGYIHVYHDPGETFSFSVLNGIIEQNDICPEAKIEDRGMYLRLPKEWGSAYIAFSDAPEDEFWSQYDDDAARKSRMHKIIWDDERISSPDTLCGVPHRIMQWVEEFRYDPGFIRAVFEYANPTIQECYDPDIEHFSSSLPLNMAERDQLNKKRWRRTQHWDSASERTSLPKTFLWRCVKKVPDRSFPPAQFMTKLLSRTGCSGLVVLSDPAGICLECAALHHYSLRAHADFLSWYAQTGALIEFIKACDSNDMLFSRQATLRQKGATGWSWPKKLAGDVATVRMKSGAVCLDQPLKALLAFWLKWLNGTGRFSFSSVAGDYTTTRQSGSDKWEDLFCQCTYEISAFGKTVERVRKVMNQNTPLAALFRDRLKNSLWPTQDDDQQNNPQGFAQLIINFSGLLPSMLDLTRGMKALPTFSEEFIRELVRMLCRKLDVPEGNAPEESHEVQLIKLLSICANITPTTRPAFLDEEVPFHIPVPMSAASDKVSGAATGVVPDAGTGDMLKGTELAVLLAHHIVQKFELPDLLVRIPRAIFTNDTSSSRSFSQPTLRVLERVLQGIACASLLSALYDQFTDSKRDLIGFVDVAANAFAVMDMCLQCDTVFKWLKDKVPDAAKRIAGQRIAMFTQQNITKVLGRTAFVLSTFWSFWSAWDDLNNNETRSAAGNALLGTGGIIIYAAGGPLGVVLGIIISAAGLFLVIFGKTSRLQYRIANSYFGEDNDKLPQLLEQHDTYKWLNNLGYHNFSRHHVENVEGFDPNSCEGIVPFSYCKGYVPPFALDCKDQSDIAPDFFVTRARQLDIELCTMTLSLLNLSMEAKRCPFKNGEIIEISIKAPLATTSSSLKITSLSIVNDNHNHPELYKITDLKSIRVTCSLKEKCPSWNFYVPIPQDICEQWSYKSTTQNMMSDFMDDIVSPAVKVTLDFQYASANEWDSQPSFQNAAALLLVEDNAYIKNGGDIENKKHFNKRVNPIKEFRVLHNHKIIAPLKFDPTFTGADLGSPG